MIIDFFYHYTFSHQNFAFNLFYFCIALTLSTKMSKITVKRFLNKRVKPTQVYSNLDELGYPLYYSITYQRKTQHVRSLTGVIMTEKAFIYFQEQGEPYDYETSFEIFSDREFLIKELSRVESAVGYIVNNDVENIFDEDFIVKLKTYFKSLSSILISIGWEKHNWEIKNLNQKSITDFSNIEDFLSHPFETSEDEKRINKLYEDTYDAYFLYHSFNNSENLLVNINRIERILKIDIREYFYADTLKFWSVIDVITQSYNKGDLIVDFVTNYDIEKFIEKNKELQYPVSDSEIIIVSDILKKYVLML